MAILGKKFGTKIRKLGAKIDDKVHMLGNKTNNVLDKVEKVNEEIIDKSGKALNVAKHVTGTGAKVLDVLNEAGIKDVPILGSATSLAETGLRGANKGIAKAEKLREDYIDKSQKGINVGRNVADNLEKHNTRKVLADMARENANDSFA